MRNSGSWQRVIALCATAWLLPGDVWAATRSLKLVTVKGEGAFNDVRARRANPPEVEVRDDEERPVANAEVSFTLPFSGAGGAFPGGERTLRTRTNTQGRATAEGLTPNGIEGRFVIVVEAFYEERKARALIHQSNTSAVESGASHGKRWLVLSSLAGAGLTAALLAVRGGSSSGQSTPQVAAPLPTSVSISGVTVGGPR